MLLLLMVPTFPTSSSTSLALPFVSSSDLILLLYSKFKPFDSLGNDPHSVCDGFEGAEICQRCPPQVNFGRQTTHRTFKQLLGSLEIHVWDVNRCQ